MSVAFNYSEQLKGLGVVVWVWLILVVGGLYLWWVACKVQVVGWAWLMAYK